MTSSSGCRLIARCASNPILTADMWPYPVNSVFNPGAVRLVDSGEVLLLVRAEDHRGISHLVKAVSRDGLTDWRIERVPTLYPDRQKRIEEIWGVEDPRITWLPELERYAVMYTAYSLGGPGVSLALTRDFAEFDHYGMIFPPEDKDAALFPRRFDGYWAAVHRPVPASGAAHIWISFSPDLRHWGNHKIVIRAREGGWWDANKVGLAVPPIETSEGWLILYHGVRRTASGSVYRVGVALLDLEDPVKLTHRGSEWVFAPKEAYERSGDVPQVVFPTGWVSTDGNETVILYYGAADTVVCAATANVRELVNWVKGHSYLPLV